METYGIEKYGITGTTEIVHNPSYELLYNEETKPGLEGYEVGQNAGKAALENAYVSAAFQKLYLPVFHSQQTVPVFVA